MSWISTVEITITQLENNVHQALVVMDADTGNLLNYRQLMRNPKYKKNWSTSSTNEFGRLENGVGGLIKNSTNTIIFIIRKNTPKNRKKDVKYGQFICSL